MIESGFPVSVRWPGGRCARRATGERALASIPPCHLTRPPPSEAFRDRDRFLGATTPPHSAMVAVVVMVAAMVGVVHVVDGQAKIHIQRRCYVCRSRGELGDCRDQFIPPEPLPPGTPVQVLGPLFFVCAVFLGVGH